MMKDSGGNRSITLTFVALSWLAGTGAFLWHVFQGNAPDLTAYALFIPAVMAVWLGREKIPTRKI